MIKLYTVTPLVCFSGSLSSRPPPSPPHVTFFFFSTNKENVDSRTVSKHVTKSNGEKHVISNAWICLSVLSLL